MNTCAPPCGCCPFTRTSFRDRNIQKHSIITYYSVVVNYSVSVYYFVIRTYYVVVRRLSSYSESVAMSDDDKKVNGSQQFELRRNFSKFI